MKASIQKNGTSFVDRLSDRLVRSERPLPRRIGLSLRRDREFSFRYLVRKGLGFFRALLASKWYLRKVTRVGRYPRVEKKPYIDNNGSIVVGDLVNICSRNVACDLVTLPNGKITVGDNVFVNFGTTIVAENRVSIGNNVKIGPYCMIHDTDFHIPGDDFANAPGVPITIEDDVWLSSRVLVMKGSVIGRGAVIAAGSVVSGFIPPYVVAGGVPARVIKDLNEDRRDLMESEGRNIAERSGESAGPEVRDAVNAVVAEVLEVCPTVLLPETKPADIPAWDGVRHLALMQELGKRLECPVPYNVAVKLNSVGRMYDWAGRRMAAVAGYEKPLEKR